MKKVVGLDFDKSLEVDNHGIDMITDLQINQEALSKMKPSTIRTAQLYLTENNLLSLGADTILDEFLESFDYGV